MIEEIKKYIRDIPDFPKQGIIFKDITPLLSDKIMFNKVINLIADRYRDKEIAKVIGVDARGFIFAAALAHALNAGMVPVRKKNKLPFDTYQETYELEYGTDTVEIHTDAVNEGERVVIVDDLLATGGTLAATCKLVERFGAEIVEVITLVELGFLTGREKLNKYNFHSLIIY